MMMDVRELHEAYHKILREVGRQCEWCSRLTEENSKLLAEWKLSVDPALADVAAVVRFVDWLQVNEMRITE